MRYSTDRQRIGVVELTYFIMAVILLLLLGVLAKGQTTTHPTAQSQVNPAVYREYRGVRLGMTTTDVRAKLGEPILKSDEQDYFVISANETTQIGYDAGKKVTTISTDYSGGVGAPDYRSVVGDQLLTRPDGSTFSMVMYQSERFWVTYNKSATMVPVVTITIGVIR